ncbi:MAG: hypothetical protein ACKVP5_00635 [Aestuariivirga sp.]
MSFDWLTTGTVIRYPYLWSHEAQRGETEGRKTKRPTAVGFRIAKPDGKDIVLLFPLTSKAPDPSRFAAEVPALEKKRAGLAQDIPLWIILDEFNEDIVGESFYLEPDPHFGRFSHAFLLPLLKEFIVRRQSIKGVSRRIRWCVESCTNNHSNGSQIPLIPEQIH